MTTTTANQESDGTGTAAPPEVAPQSGLNKSKFSWSIISICLATFVVAVSCVLALPLFPTKRRANHAQLYVRLFLNAIAIGCICRVSQPWRNLKRTWRYFGWRARHFVGAEVFTPRPEYPLAPFNYLAKMFFAVTASIQLWRMVNDLYFLIRHAQLPDCANPIAFPVNATQLVLGSLLFIAIIAKSNGGPPKPKVVESLLLWALVGAISFGIAFSEFVDEAMWGYIEIVGISLEQPEYGLNFTNCSTIKDCVDPLFKSRAACIEHEVWPAISHHMVEIIPISAEYFALATFACVIEWQRAGHNSSNEEQAHQVTTTLRTGHHCCDHSCVFSIGGRVAAVVIVLLLTATIAEIAVFNHTVHHQMVRSVGVWIFVGHLVTGQLLLLAAELWYYLRHLKRMRANPKPPAHEKLNIMLLVFPLLPLGVLYTLQIFPRLALIARGEYVDPSSVLWTVIYILKAALHLIQTGFQSMFIAQVFCIRESHSYRSSRWFFAILGVVNFCIWLGWTFMCKWVTILGNSREPYGEVAWVAIVYGTVPFALFCYAHASACCMEIWRETYKKSSSSKSRDGAAVDMETVHAELLTTADVPGKQLNKGGTI